MKAASRIMILCGYRSYEKEKRFRQKIQNILKKEKKQNIPRPHQDMNSISSDDQVTNDVPFPFDQETNEQQPLINQNKMNEQQQILSENKRINKSYKPSYDEDSSVYTNISDFNINNDYPLLHQSVTNNFDYNNYHDPMFQEDYFSDELYPYDFDLNDLSYPCEYPAYQHNLSDNIIF